MVEKRTIVLYPHLGPNTGTGHIKRLLPFLNDSRFDVFITHRDSDYIKEIATILNISKDKIFSLKEIKLLDKQMDLVLLDNKETDRYLYDILKKIGPIVAIDEGGDARSFVPYCIDILPNLIESDPNYYNPGLLDLERKEPVIRELKKILVTFGGQDPFKLTNKIVESFSDKYEITTVIGPLYKKRDFGVEKIENPDSLKKIIPDFDLVITSFGITAFESVALGVPVALYNPTEYHQDLSDKSGFYSIDIKSSINYKKAYKSISKINLGTPESLVDFIYSLDISNNGCPLCSRKNSTIINRYKNKSYFNCSHCSLDYMLSHVQDNSYNKDYFFEEYKNQYGKTYLEDFNHIQNVGKDRIKTILKKIKPGNTLIDIGCAFGPFLKASESFGLRSYGLDISKEAIDFVTNKLHIPSIESSFPITKPLEFEDTFDSLTMWFVIEHFKNLDSVMSQVNTLINKGGVFAFSTPNSSGISAKRNYKNFLKNSPIDHYTLWNPKTAKKILKDYGFKVYKIKITGHHPERFGKIVKGKFLNNIFMLISKILKLGDTFEVYSIKENNL